LKARSRRNNECNARTVGLKLCPTMGRHPLPRYRRGRSALLGRLAVACYTAVWGKSIIGSVGRAVALVLKGNNYECILFDDGCFILVLRVGR
jgi:hypothetical protein